MTLTHSLSGSKQADEMRAKELQTATMEKQDILQFEIHLAAATNKATITESNSLLLAQLITNDPEGNFRRPPQTVLDQLAQANQHYKIGHLLCRSRNPDFLLNILNRQVSHKFFPYLFFEVIGNLEGGTHVQQLDMTKAFDSAESLFAGLKSRDALVSRLG